MNQHLLGPEVAIGIFVDEIGSNATERTTIDVQNTKHGSPITRGCLSKFGEILEIVGAKNTIDSQLRAKRIEVACAEN